MLDSFDSLVELGNFVVDFTDEQIQVAGMVGLDTVCMECTINKVRKDEAAAALILQ